ncbi:MAG TPA: trypsin-like serine protease [Leptolyngbyaceae cyanobacterium M33_DOE_097]|nr:trypsin-like serine protease [Leptolyngbyaceae cyanobacterium M33_DOE_097]
MKVKRCLCALAGATTVTLNLSWNAQAIVTVDDSTLFDRIVQPGQYSGVVSLEGYFDDTGSTPFCTGSLLTGGRHLLTAAHCLTEPGTNTLFSFLTEQPFFANFNLINGVTPVSIREFFVFPDWDGFVGNGNDIAILALQEPAPDEAEQYDIYRDTDELGQTFIKVGYGTTGTGFEGETTPNGFLPFFGQNQFEGTELDRFDLLRFPGNPSPFSQLLFDFDNGLPANNLLGSLGLGRDEVNTASGDSGGPAFIGDRIAGITSYGTGGFGLALPTDIDTQTNSSFGELSGETRVSTYASFIDAVLLGQVAPSGYNTTTIPEPATILGISMFGFILLGSRKIKS